MTERTARIDITATGINAELRVRIEDNGRSMGTFNLSAREARRLGEALQASADEAIKAPDGIVVSLSA